MHTYHGCWSNGGIRLTTKLQERKKRKYEERCLKTGEVLVKELDERNLRGK